MRRKKIYKLFYSFKFRKYNKIRRHKDAFRIPLADSLFGDLALNVELSVPPLVSKKRTLNNHLDKEKSTDCVNWSRRGMVRSKEDPHKNARAGLQTQSAIYIPRKSASQKIAQLEDVNDISIESSDELSDEDGDVVLDSAGYEDNELTDNDNEDPDGWIVKRSNFAVIKYGNAAIFVGRTFSIIEENMTRARVSFGKEVKHGIIISVVCKKHSTTLYFRGYDNKQFRTVPTSTNSCWWTIECAALMNTSVKKKIVEWDDTLTATGRFKGVQGFLGEGMIGRRILKPFGGRYYSGKIVSYSSNYYGILYSDGDSEDLNEKAMLTYLRA